MAPPRSQIGIALGLCLIASAPAGAAELKLPRASIQPTTFAALPGWQDDDHVAAFETFSRSCSAILQSSRHMPARRPLLNALFKACEHTKTAGKLDREQARAFFEANFRPARIAPAGETEGFFTGYYETEFDGSRYPSTGYTVPIYAAPAAALRAHKSEVFANLDRSKIEDGAIAGKGLEICYVKDPIDAFFAQIQGSTRVKLDNGKLLRLNYIASNGQRYTPVGKFLIDRGIYSKEEMSMDKIREWMEANPAEGKDLRRKNRSFVFFQETPLGENDECIGAQGIALTPLRSLAVDRRIHTYGTPIWIDADLPIANEKPDSKFRRLLFAQDTGSAIVGPARADIYFGHGEAISHIAGRIKQHGQFVMLVPQGMTVHGTKAEPASDIPLPSPRPRPLVAEAMPVSTVPARKSQP